jgi:hypothetical protein
MALKLTPQSNLESLRKEAKRRLKALRAGDPQEHDRLGQIHPGHKAATLRVVQHALALEYGFSSWAALKRELEERAFAARSHHERVTLFLEKSANRAGDGCRHRPVQPRYPWTVFRGSHRSPHRIVRSGSLSCICDHARRTAAICFA